MKFRSKIATCLVGGICALGSEAAANTPPAKGLYFTQAYVSAESAACQGVLAPAGATLFGFFDYPGANAAGALLRFPGVGNGAGGVYNYVQLLGFPTTPATGQSAWSGNYSGTFLPTSPTLMPVGTFVATLTYGNTESFFMTITYTFAVSGAGTCTATFVHNFTKA